MERIIVNVDTNDSHSETLKTVFGLISKIKVTAKAVVLPPLGHHAVALPDSEQVGLPVALHLDLPSG